MSEIAIESKLSETLKQARALIQGRDFKGAFDILNRARKDQFEGSEPSQQEELFYCLGVCLNGLERPAEALGHFSRSLALAEQLKDPSAQARSLEEVGGAQHQRGDFRQAQAFYERALRLYVQLEDKAGQARGLRNLAGAKVDQGLATAAVEDYKSARVLFAEVGDTEGIATCVTNLALLTYRHHGRQATIDEYKRQLEAGDCKHFLVYNNLGFLLLLDEQLDEARKYLDFGVEDCKERGVQDDNIGLLFLNLGILGTLQERFDEADGFYRQASEVFAQFPMGRAVEIVLLPKTASEDHQLGRFFVTEDGHKLAVTFLNTAVSAANRGDLDLALELAQKSCEMDREQAYPLAVLGWIHMARKEDQAAASAFARANGREPRNEFFKRSLDLVNPYLSKKVGRNDPCPCGSGKKFKKCHGGV